VDIIVSNKADLKGSINTPPPSKSHTMRAILLGSLCSGVSTIRNYLRSQDTEYMINSCRMIGADITCYEDKLKIKGVAGRLSLPHNIIYAGNSGLILRLFTGICSVIEGYSVITGDRSIRTNRSVKQLLKGICQLNASAVSTKNNGYAPIIIRGKATPGRVSISGEDSQEVSSLLLSTAFLKGTTDIYVSNPGETPWIDVTLSWMDRLGVKYDRIGYKYYSVEGRDVYPSFDYHVAADFSSISFPLVLSIITNSEVTFNNIDMKDIQGDKKIIDIAKKMGANIEVGDDKITVRKSDGLRGIIIDANDCIDAVAILTVLANYADGKTTINNASIARHKECDRLSTITSEMKKLGASITEKADGLVISPSALVGTTVASHGDHRIAMALCIAGISATGVTTVKDIGCISKTYPNFVSDLYNIGANIKVV
jgi:3-phosphoshikimate 1-carboxyvinyltransferase